MKLLVTGAFTFGTAFSCFGQSVQELQRTISDQKSTIEKLERHVELLERELTPHFITRNNARLPATPDGEQADSNRALERALVREGSLLLSPKKVELEPNVVYSHNSGDAGFRRTSYGPSFIVRAGLPWRSQVEVEFPYVIERIRDTNGRTSSRGIGDMSMRLSHQLRSEKGMWPSLVGSLGYQAATGRNTSYEQGPLVAHGSGFPSLQGSLSVIKRADPLVFFGNYSYTYIYGRDKAGAAIQPGSVSGLRVGVALATAPATSLRAGFNLNFLSATKINGRPVPTEDTNAFFEIGGSAVLTESTALDVAIAVGVTRSAPDFRLMVSLPVRF
ncbi:MAG: hypothetical protein H7335_00985 [Massilia sp.]|nr:hypothetical protein [Massilia sp.]